MAKKKTPKRCEPLQRYMEINRISTDELADRLRVASSTARSLVNGNRQVTAEKAVDIEKRIGIPREALRPDLFVRRAA